jgi:hypothetical protein
VVEIRYLTYHKSNLVVILQDQRVLKVEIFLTPKTGDLSHGLVKSGLYILLKSFLKRLNHGFDLLEADLVTFINLFDMTFNLLHQVLLET